MTGQDREPMDVSAYCRLRIDREGRWYCDGREVVHPAIYLHFNRCLHMDSAGRYFICTGGQTCTVEVEDAPFVVVRVEREERASDEPGNILIHLNDATCEPLMLNSLWIGEHNVLYCKVKEGLFHARFLRPAYYHLAEFVQCEQSTGMFYILHGGERYYISGI